MKRKYVLLAVLTLVAVLVATCSLSQEKKKPDWPAWLSPSEYASFSTDAHVVTARKADGDSHIWVYTREGRFIDAFDTFNHMTHGDTAVYYIGTAYNRYGYYFPATDVVVNTRRVYPELDYLLYLEPGGGWHFRSYDGALLYSVPAGAVLIRQPLQKSSNSFATAVDTPSGHVLYNEYGQPTDTLSPRRWQQLQARFTEAEQLGGVTLVVRQE